MSSLRQIAAWVAALTKSLGDPRPSIDVKKLEALHAEKRHTEIVRAVARHFGLNAQLTVAFVNAGGPKNWAAWVDTGSVRGVFGTEEFKRSRVTVYLRRSFLAKAPCEVVVSTLGHEFSHVLLESLVHPLRKEEKVVDLTAMMLGCRGFWQQTFRFEYVEEEPRRWFNLLRKPAARRVTEDYRIGYLSEEEERFARRLMRT